MVIAQSFVLKYNAGRFFSFILEKQYHCCYFYVPEIDTYTERDIFYKMTTLLTKEKSTWEQVSDFIYLLEGNLRSSEDRR